MVLRLSLHCLVWLRNTELWPHSSTLPPTAQITSISSGEVTLTNSGPLSGLSLPSARTAVMDQARKEGIGGHHTSSNPKDWLISRQIYWGTPIPVVHCFACDPVPVPAYQLPVTLPPMSGDQLASKGPSPLFQCEDWLATTCPMCGGQARRETDTMDTLTAAGTSSGIWIARIILNPSLRTQ